ncbi:MAG: hypothetical protein E7393_03240 [Ruminococcaceae bacterium]|nr:hypothetical protein [Oscillospiraceae bacterium]
MYVEKFLQQVHRKLNEQGITNSKLRDTCIDIYEGEIEIFKIDREGGMFYASDNRFRSFESKYSCDDVQGDIIPGYKGNFQNTFNAYAAISRTGYRTNFAMSYDFKDANDTNAKVGHVDVVLNEVTRIYGSN